MDELNSYDVFCEHFLSLITKGGINRSEAKWPLKKTKEASVKMKKWFNGSIVVFGALLLLMSVGGFEAVSAKTFPVLETPAGVKDEGHNAEGIKHYNKGDWNKAAKHFRGAVKEAPKMAEGHYNLALALDKLKNHREATKFFASAVKLAPDNPAIKDSKILKAHLE